MLLLGGDTCGNPGERRQEELERPRRTYALTGPALVLPWPSVSQLGDAGWSRLGPVGSESESAKSEQAKSEPAKAESSMRAGGKGPKGALQRASATSHDCLTSLLLLALRNTRRRKDGKFSCIIN